MRYDNDHDADGGDDYDDYDGDAIYKKMLVMIMIVNITI